MLTLVKNAFLSVLLFTVLTGIVYPLAVTGIAQAFFPCRANGSIIIQDGKAVGSALIGQEFKAPEYFWGRPSATTPYPYNGGSSKGSNLGPNNPDLREAVQARIDTLHAADPGNTREIPVDLVTASGSGLDPHISPAAAEFQLHRVAKARGLDESAVQALIAGHTEGRWLGIVGEPVVNVLELNLALDRDHSRGQKKP